MAGSVVTDLAGRMLAGRYLLQAAIGTGASGRVYVADDTRLRRRVAVKVLHAALSEDSAFLRRFRAEAQLAASLHHPHIVTVHDWGEDDLPFMVLELLEGGSLRGMLDEGTLLSVAQATRVGRDVASALDYAHVRGVLHRDIKPANLLFDEHGIVRVADFGLARALAEASWTEPAGAVFGTARYASPEQALGTQLDARSDLYSLALVLVEAVTGRVPFTSDTTIGMLTARTQRSLTAPEEVGPIGPVVERAGRVDASERYPDAATMRQALSDVAESLPPPGPLTLAGMIDKIDPNPTRVAPEKPAVLFDQDSSDGSPKAAREPADSPPAVAMVVDRFSASPRRMVPYVVALVLAITVALAAAALARVGSRPIQVPGLIGLTQIDARSTASRVGLDVVGVDREQAPDPAGVVIAQQPEPGMWTRGAKVRLTVSDGPAKVTIPAVVQQAWPDAQRTLDAAGFVYKSPPSEQYDETVAAGLVLSLTPAPGALVAPDTELQVTLSKGHAPVKVPDLSGKTFDEAAAALEAVHLHAQRGEDQFSDTVAKDTVLATNPGPDGESPYDGPVVVVISKGPDVVAVPDVKGKTIEVAQNSIELQGLKVGSVAEYRRNGVVLAQNPEPGVQVRRGSSVDLLLDKP